MPTIPGSKASGAIIKVAGITGRIRGMKFKRADGHSVRPSLVVLDDPQTDESARSLSQCATRESILAGAVLGLAGPGKKIAGIMPCTVIRPGDMADRSSTATSTRSGRASGPRWSTRFPTNEKLWAKYAEIRAESLRAERGLAGRHGVLSARHREAMDAGAVIAWPERYNHDELSAIQHAMNLKLQDEAAFLAEYQNEPLPEETPQDDELYGRPGGREDQPPAAWRRAGRLQPPDDVHRRAGGAAVLRRGRLGGRFHRLRDRLRRLSRPEAALLHAPRRPANAGAGRPQAPAWKARSMPGWRRSPTTAWAGNGGGTTGPACGSSAA